VTAQGFARVDDDELAQRYETIAATVRQHGSTQP